MAIPPKTNNLYNDMNGSNHSQSSQSGGNSNSNYNSNERGNSRRGGRRHPNSNSPGGGGGSGNANYSTNTLASSNNSNVALTHRSNIRRSHSSDLEGVGSNHGGGSSHGRRNLGNRNSNFRRSNSGDMQDAIRLVSGTYALSTASKSCHNFLGPACGGGVTAVASSFQRGNSNDSLDASSSHSTSSVRSMASVGSSTADPAVSAGTNANGGKFVHSYSKPVMPARSQYLAMDCEMVQGATSGKSLCARVVLVDWKGRSVLDTYVQPTEPVSDYRTFVSGITAEDLKDADSLTNVQARVMALLNPPSPGGGVETKILVGHGLQNDLDCLGITHPWHLIRDTAYYEPFMKTIVLPPHVLQLQGLSPSDAEVLSPRKLKELATEKLQREIQAPGKPHCPNEDAVAALDLYKSHRPRWEACITSQVNQSRRLQQQAARLEKILQQQELLQQEQAAEQQRQALLQQTHHQFGATNAVTSPSMKGRTSPSSSSPTSTSAFLIGGYTPSGGYDDQSMSNNQSQSHHAQLGYDSLSFSNHHNHHHVHRGYDSLSLSNHQYLPRQQHQHYPFPQQSQSVRGYDSLSVSAHSSNSNNSIHGAGYPRPAAYSPPNRTRSTDRGGLDELSAHSYHSGVSYYSQRRPRSPAALHDHHHQPQYQHPYGLQQEQQPSQQYPFAMQQGY